MTRYAGMRLVSSLPIALIVATFSFLLIELIPGSPAIAMLGEQATVEAVAALEREMGLDKPLPVRFVWWLAGLVRGDLGNSIVAKRPVSELLAAAVGPSLALAAAGLLFSMLIGISVGVTSAALRGSVVDQLSTLGAIIGASAPSFWLGLNLMLGLSLTLRLLPTSGYATLATEGLSALRYLVLPGLAIGVPSAASLARITRSAMLDVLQADYIRTARAKGVASLRVIMGHAFRVASPTVVTVISYTFLDMLSRAVVVEAIFRIPGLGSLAVYGINNRDYPVVQGVILIVAFGYIIANLMTDLSYSLLDPRIQR